MTTGRIVENDSIIFLVRKAVYVNQYTKSTEDSARRKTPGALSNLPFLSTIIVIIIT